MDTQSYKHTRARAHVSMPARHGRTPARTRAGEVFDGRLMTRVNEVNDDTDVVSVTPVSLWVAHPDEERLWS